MDHPGREHIEKGRQLKYSLRQKSGSQASSKLSDSQTIPNIVGNQERTTLAVQQKVPNLPLKSSRMVWAADSRSTMAKVVDPLPDIRTTDAPFARRNS